MEGEEEGDIRRCRFLYSTSMPRHRAATVEIPLAQEEVKQAAAKRGRSMGKSALCSLDEEEVLFEARPASVDVICRPSTPKGKLLDSGSKVAWPDWESPARHGRMSTASTSAGSSCYSPRRQSRSSRQSTSSWGSMSVNERLPEPASGKALLASFPLPVGIRAWDWPLSRHEKKSLLLMFDRQELMVQRDELADELSELRNEAC